MRLSELELLPGSSERVIEVESIETEVETLNESTLLGKKD